MLTESNQFLDLLKTEFKNKDTYYCGERIINKTSVDDKINLNVCRSNQSSIYYNYYIYMGAYIDDVSVQIKINTETSTSRGDPYCGRGHNKDQKEYNYSKNINDFSNHQEIVEYISSTFYKHYFTIESRN